jgi:hypothetical protein
MKKLATFAIVLVLLGACSATGLLYSFADDYIEDKAEFYLLLDEDAEAYVDGKIDEFMDWHRANMLPQYAAYLSRQADAIEAAGSGVGRDQVFGAVDQLRGLLEVTVRGFTPFTGDVLARHTGKAETSYLGQRLAERNKEQREEMAEPAESRAEGRAERTQENFERFTGDLNEKQLQIIRRHTATTAGDTKRRLDRRARNSKRFIGFLSSAPGKTEIQAFLDAMFLNPDAGAPKTEAGFRATRFRRFQILVADILTTLSAEQRQNLIENLRDFAEDFRTIAS